MERQWSTCRAGIATGARSSVVAWSAGWTAATCTSAVVAFLVANAAERTAAEWTAASAATGACEYKHNAAESLYASARGASSPGSNDARDKSGTGRGRAVGTV